MLKSYDIWRINLPLGREIGDNMCRYDHFHVCVVKLEDETGLQAWGYGEKVAEGHFSKPVSWLGAIPPAAQIRRDFQKKYWEALRAAPTVDHIFASGLVAGDHYLHNALRYALWDLKAKQAGLPLYQLLNPNAHTPAMRAYASGLDFHQPIEWMLDFYGRKIAQGFRMIKLKVGHPDPEWDLRRLLAIREAFGNDIEMAIDANIAWDAATALKRLTYFQQHGADLAYVEDPLPPQDLAGYRILAKELPLPIAGHDYIPDPNRLRPLLDTNALTYLRIRDGVDYGIRAAKLADEYGLTLIHCNTFMEWGLHVGLGNPRADRIEFADLGWNNLAKTPFRIENGLMYAHDTPGHGLDPQTTRLEQWTI